MLKIRRPLGRLIFNMGIAIPGKTVFLIETAPCINYNAHTEPLLKALDILKIEDMLKLNVFKFYFKYTLGILPSYFYTNNIETFIIATIHDSKISCEQTLRKQNTQTSRCEIIYLS